MDKKPTLVLMNNGNLALFGKSTTQIWSSNSHHGGQAPDHEQNIGHWLRKRDSLYQGQILHAGKKIVSKNKQFRAIMQKDGNFVVYHNKTKPIWASNTHGLNGNLHLIV